jgi:anti-sigma B factor antagonist
MHDVGGGFPDRPTAPEVPLPHRPIDDSLLERVRLTMTSTQRRRGRFHRADPRVVAPAGEIDIATAPRLHAEIKAAFASGAEAVRIDLSATTFMDSSGLHVLIEAVRRAQALDRELTIASVPPNVRRVIAIAGFEDVLPLSDEAAA